MAIIRDFEEIDAWKEARTLVKSVYRICKEGELSKDFGLRDQIRRSVVSISSNIAEGFGREGSTEFARFLRIAKGSACEFRSQLWNLLDAEYIDIPTFEQLRSDALKTERLIGGFINYLSKQ